MIPLRPKRARIPFVVEHGHENYRIVDYQRTEGGGAADVYEEA